MRRKSGELLLLDGLADAIARAGGIHVDLPENPPVYTCRLFMTLGVSWAVASGPGRRVPPVEERECKIEGCPFVVVNRFGKFAGLCEEHAAARSRELAEAKKSGATVPPLDAGAKPPAKPKEGEEQSLQALARELVPAAAALERKLDARKTARTDAQAAFEEFKARLDALSQAVRTLVA